MSNIDLTKKPENTENAGQPDAAKQPDGLNAANDMNAGDTVNTVNAGNTANNVNTVSNTNSMGGSGTNNANPNFNQNPNYNPNYNPNNNQNYNQNYNQVVDNGGFLWGLLGCCIPLVGLILFLVWKDQKPRTAKAAGIGALVSVIIWIIYYIAVFVLGIGLALL